MRLFWRAVHLPPVGAARVVELTRVLYNPLRELASPALLYPDAQRLAVVLHAGIEGTSSYECNDLAKWTVVDHGPNPSVVRRPSSVVRRPSSVSTPKTSGRSRVIQTPETDSLELVSIDEDGILHRRTLASQTGRVRAIAASAGALYVATHEDVDGDLTAHVAVYAGTGSCTADPD